MLATFLIAVSMAASDPISPTLRDEIEAMVKVDQEARMTMLAKSGEVPKDSPEAARVRQIDEGNTARMKHVVSDHGWPGRALIGASGSHDAWLLVQHADRDPAFQKRCLALMEDAVARGDADGRDLAYLVDRVRVAEGKPQRYGTQFVGTVADLKPSPIEDEAHVDDRRKSVGLNAMAEYADELRAMYRSVPSPKAN